MLRNVILWFCMAVFFGLTCHAGSAQGQVTTKGGGLALGFAAGLVLPKEYDPALSKNFHIHGPLGLRTGLEADLTQWGLKRRLRENERFQYSETSVSMTITYTIFDGSLFRMDLGAGSGIHVSKRQFSIQTDSRADSETQLGLHVIMDISRTLSRQLQGFLRARFEQVGENQRLLFYGGIRWFL